MRKLIGATLACALLAGCGGGLDSGDVEAKLLSKQGVGKPRVSCVGDDDEFTCRARYSDGTADIYEARCEDDRCLFRQTGTE